MKNSKKRVLQTVLLRGDERLAVLNRGEPALRFLRAVREYNHQFGTRFETVVPYIPTDQDSAALKMADYAFPLAMLERYSRIQPTKAFLDWTLLREMLASMGCSGVWCGWGFLSEDAGFVQFLSDEGICFIGPNWPAMKTLGDKISAKILAEKLKIPVLPWSRRALKTLAEVSSHASRIGFPLLLKSSMTGGGRGIRIVRSMDDLAVNYQSVIDESARFGGEANIFLERYIENARHLEVQTLSDHHGSVVTFGLRDCSVQRRYQKIIEETPARNVDSELVSAMETAAERLILAASYTSAATVEFIFDVQQNRSFFMEVNTRLQVEHTITEERFGIDLVKEQLTISRGGKVRRPARPFKSMTVIEARINAEDVERGFSPSPGRVRVFVPPTGPGIRVDAGIEEGSIVPHEFDSMIAKIITRGANREEALARLVRSLQELRIKIDGGTTNRAFLLELLNTPQMQRGAVTTSFVADFIGEGDYRLERTDWDIAIIAYALRLYLQRYDDELANFKHKFARLSVPPPAAVEVGDRTANIVVQHEGNDYNFMIRSVGNNVFHLMIDSATIIVQYIWKNEEAIILHDRRRYAVQMVDRGDMLQCDVNGIPYHFTMVAHGSITSPSPAMIVSLNVTVGQRVNQGDVLAILEAMKMEMLLTSPMEGTIRSINVREGMHVMAGRVLLEIDALTDIQPETSTRISFETLRLPDRSCSQEAVLQHWQMLQRDFLAVFLGYDYHQPDTVLDEMRVFASEYPGYWDEFVRTLVHAIEVHSAIEKLFSHGTIIAEGFARRVTFQDLLFHYFLRVKDRDRGLPSSFLDLLASVIHLYPWARLEDHEATTRALFRIFRSHSHFPIKQRLLHSVLKSLVELYPYCDGGVAPNRLADILSDFVALSSDMDSTLVDRAIHARYELVDRAIIERLRTDHYQGLSRMLETIVAGTDDKDPAALAIYRGLIDAGDHIMHDLVRRGLSDSAAGRRLSLELAGHRFHRDLGKNYSLRVDANDLSMCHITIGEFPHQRKTLMLMGTISSASDLLSKAEAVLQAGPTADGEIILLMLADNDKDCIEKLVRDRTALCAAVHIGVYGEKIAPIVYRSWTRQKGILVEDEQHRGFSPLMFRELRVDRFRNFITTTLYRSEYVHLLHAVARENTKDERFFVLVDVAETHIERTSDRYIKRILAFEHALTEASQAIRAEQARRRRRFFWNRIIVHVRSPLDISGREFRDYIRGVGQRLLGLGLEKIVLYARTRSGNTDEITEHLFENIPGSLLSYRTRKPSDGPLLPLDAYSSRVVRAAQRGNFYPYQIIKMLTDTGESSERFPRGGFEEFDIRRSRQTQEWELVSVAGRPLGNNSSNIVFGIITNEDAALVAGLSRVIILGDPTRDMGALGEEECRRINMAIDLAEERSLPVEWIAVSAGARIDMDTGTENLDWTARTLQRIITFTQNGGEINLIVADINVGAQSYWNAEATMLMHTRGLLIMTERGAMLLTGKKALDVSGGVSAEDNVAIGGVERIMGPNGEAQIAVKDLPEAYDVLFRHYSFSYVSPGECYPPRRTTIDPIDRDICQCPYIDRLDQGFKTIGDIFTSTMNPDRKKPFDMRQVMEAVIDQDHGYFERWLPMKDAETAIVWETRLGGIATGLIGIESRPLIRLGIVPNDGPEYWSGGTLFPQSSRKIARAINAFSGRLPLVVLANLSGFDGSPESLRNCQLEYGAEIGRAIVNYSGPIVFVVVARYHGGAYVVFSQALNPNLQAIALEGTFASVIGGSPAAMVVFPRMVLQETWNDPRIVEIQQNLKTHEQERKKEFDQLFQQVMTEKQTAVAARFDCIHSVERALEVGSIKTIIGPTVLRPHLIQTLEEALFLPTQEV